MSVGPKYFKWEKESLFPHSTKVANSLNEKQSVSELRVICTTAEGRAGGATSIIPIRQNSSRKVERMTLKTAITNIGLRSGRSSSRGRQDRLWLPSVPVAALGDSRGQFYDQHCQLQINSSAFWRYKINPFQTAGVRGDQAGVLRGTHRRGWWIACPWIGRPNNPARRIVERAEDADDKTMEEGHRDRKRNILNPHQYLCSAEHIKGAFHRRWWPSGSAKRFPGAVRRHIS